MATLEKIRKKSVLLIVIIGAALLAFILGDALTNGRTLFGSGTTVAQLGDAKVDITEYQQMVEMSGNQDDPTLPQQVIDELLDEKIIDNAADKLGLQVSDEMVTYFIMEIPLQQTPNGGISHNIPAVNRFINAYGEQFVQANPKARENITNLRYWHNVIFSPEKYGVKPEAMANIKQGWLFMEGQAKNEIRRMLYTQLLSGMITPNALEKKAMYAEHTDMTTVDFAFKPYPADLSAYKVSEEELQDEYNKTKNNYRLVEDSKTVGVLAYHIVPSAEDYKNAEKIKTEAIAALKAGSKLSKDLLNAGVTTDKLSVSASSLAQSRPQIAAFLTDSTNQEVGVFENNGSFELVKVISKDKMANDGVQVAFIGAQKDQVANVKNDLKSGIPVDSLSKKYAADQVYTMNNPTMEELQNPNARTQLAQIAPNLAERLDTVAPGAILDLQSTEDATMLAYVMDVKPKVPVYELELMSYTLLPSKETIEKAEADMSKYAASNNTPAKFAAGAKKAGYTYINEVVTASTPGFKTQPQDMQTVGNRYYNIPGNKLVSWIMSDGEPGQVSEVVYNDNRENPFIYIAMIEDEYEDFIPYTDTYVKSQLEKTIQARKAGEDMVKKFSGKGDINATATAMESSVVPDAEVSYAFGPIADLPVLARIAAMQPANKVTLLKGKNGVYAVTVKAKTPAKAKMTKEDGKAFARSYKSKYLGGNKHRRLIRGNERKTNRLYDMTGTR